MQVRKIIQRVRVADLEKFDELCAELDAALVERVETLGHLADAVRGEAEKALDQARQRIEKDANAAAEEEKRKEEEEQKKKEKAEAEAAQKKADEEKALVLAEEAGLIVEAVEAVAAKAGQAAEVLALSKEALASSPKQAPEDIVAAVAATEESAKETLEQAEAAKASLLEKKKEWSQLKAGQQIDFKALHKRLADAKGKVEQLQELASRAKERAGRLEKEAQREQGQKELFGKFDLDADGKLSRSEIATLAKDHYGLTPADAFLDRHLRVMSKEGDGIAFESFRRLQAIMAIEKSTASARLKKAEEEEVARTATEEKARQDAEFEEQKALVDKAIQEAWTSYDIAKAAVTKAQQSSKTLYALSWEEGPKAAELREAAITTTDELKLAKDEIASTEEILKKAGDIGNADNAKLTALKTKVIGGETRRITTLQAQLAKVEKSLAEVAAMELKMRRRELEELRLKVVPCVVSLLQAKEQSAEQLFESFAGAGKETLGSSEFLAFVRSVAENTSEASMAEALRADVLDDAQVERLFVHCVTADSGGIEKGRFENLFALGFYRVVKSGMLTEEQGVTSKSVQKLEEGSLVRLIEAPKIDEEIKVTRIVCCLHKDDTIKGWATVKGNKGTVFLEYCQRFQSCAKETMLAEAADTGSKTVRKLAKGEIVEVLEWDSKEVTTVSRLRVAAVLDGATGWVSLAASSGAAFLVAC